MHLWKSALIASLLTGPALPSALAAAGPRLDLDRVRPVPAGETIPIVDFFRPAQLRDPILNPGGTRVAALISPGDDHYRLIVVDLGTQKFDTLTAPGDADIYNIRWLNDQRLIFGLSTQKMYGVGLLSADAKNLNDCNALLQYCGASLVSVPRANRLRPLAWMRYDNGIAGGVVAVDTERRSKTPAKPKAGWNDYSAMFDNNNDHIVSRYPLPKVGLSCGYLADKDGELAFAFTADKGVLAMHRLADQAWEPCPIDLEKTDIFGSGNQPGEIAVSRSTEAGKPWTLQLMDAATGQAGAVLIQDKAYDFHGWLYRDPATGVIVGAVYQRSGPAVAWFDEDYRALQKILDGFFPGVIVRIRGNDETRKRFLVETFSDRQPSIYYSVDLEHRTVGLIKNSAPWIEPARMQPMNVMKYKTRDGRQLDAYVTLPAGASKQHPPPLIVLPHGGPWVRDEWGFDGEVQFLASRGYAVLQPNYRGSPGYEWMFPETDLWDFRKMHDDVTDATKALVGSGLVDADRVAIMGGSFGGYLAICGAVNEPALYRCAVTIAGIFDWSRVVGEQKYYEFDHPSYARMVRKLGDPKKEKEKFDEISPVRRIERVRAPVFVAHGGDDPVASVTESKRLISELEKYRVEHEALIVGREGHGMHHIDNQVELYARIEAFLDRHLMHAPPRTAAVPVAR